MSEYYLLVDSKGNATEVKGETKIGRSKTNDLVLSDPLSSRHHATVYYEGDVLMIRDEHSVNGTIVNRGQIYDPAALNDRDSIQFGDEVFTVRAPIAEAATILKPKKAADEVSPPTKSGGDQTVASIPAANTPPEPAPVPTQQAEPDEKNNNNRKILIIAVVAVLVLCVCCVITGIVANSMGLFDVFSF